MAYENGVKLEEKEEKMSREIPIRRVSLHREGTMHVLHEGSVNSGTSAEFSVSGSSLNHLISSFTALDVSSDQSKILSIQYDNPEVNYFGTSNLAFVLPSLIGVEISVSTESGTKTGKLVGCEMDQFEQREKKHILLMDKEGTVHFVPLHELRSFTVLDPAVKKEMEEKCKYRGQSNAHKIEVPVKNSEVANEEKRLRVQYSTYCSPWKMIYHVVLPPSDQSLEQLKKPIKKEKKEVKKEEKNNRFEVLDSDDEDEEEDNLDGPMILAFAEIRNSSKYDWDKVEISLVSKGISKPPSFVNPGTFAQPHAFGQVSPLFGQAAPAFGNLFGQNSVPSFGQASLGFRQFPPSTNGFGGAPASSTFGSSNTSTGFSFGSAGATGFGSNVNNNNNNALFTSAAPPHTDEEQFGAANARSLNSCEQFEIDLPNPLTLKSGQSALVPILFESLRGKQRFIWSESNQSKWTKTAIELKNSTKFIFESGPITFMDAETSSFIGQSQLPTLRPKEDSLVSFGVSRNVSVVRSEPTETFKLESVSMENGNVVLKTLRSRITNYCIKNKSNSVANVTLNHIKLGGEYDEETKKYLNADKTAFEIEIQSLEGFNFQVVENVEMISVSSNILNRPESDIQRLRQWNCLSQEMTERLDKIKSAKEEVFEMEGKLKNLHREEAALLETQNRAKSNLSSMGTVTSENGQHSNQIAEQIVTLEKQIQEIKNQGAKLYRLKEDKVDSVITETKALKLNHSPNLVPVQSERNPYTLS